MKLFRVFGCAMIMAMGVTCAAAAAPMARKVESFDFLVDRSGSMMMRNTLLGISQTALARDVLAKLNSSIPDLGYNASLHTFAPAGTVLSTGQWQRAIMAQKISDLGDDLPIVGRMTPLSPDLTSLEPEFALMKRPAVVLLVSDGVANVGPNPRDEVRNIYETQPGICFHVISLADTEAGEQVLNDIAALKECSVLAKATDLLDSQAAMDKFVSDVFFVGALAPAAVPAQPAAVPARSQNVESAIVLHGVNFAFDSAELDAKARGTLDGVAQTLIARRGLKITLEGWTDWTGTDEYNLNLAQRRANAVRSYLVSKGVPAADIVAVGRGKSSKYDNRTTDGRYLNRRTEVVFAN